MTITQLPADLAADLLAHGIDPARAHYRHNLASIANGRTRVIVFADPARVALFWPLDRGWVLKVDGRIVRRPFGGPKLFASAGAALN